MKQTILGVILGLLVLMLLLSLPSVHAERASIPLLSPPIPPVPPLCGPGITGDCVEWNEDLRDLRDDRFISPLPQPVRHCGKRYGENWCD